MNSLRKRLKISHLNCPKPQPGTGAGCSLSSMLWKFLMEEHTHLLPLTYSKRKGWILFLRKTQGLNPLAWTWIPNALRLRQTAQGRRFITTCGGSLYSSFCSFASNLVILHTEDLLLVWGAQVPSTDDGFLSCCDNDTLPSAPEPAVLQGCWNGWPDAANTNHRSASQTELHCAILVGNYTIYSQSSVCAHGGVVRHWLSKHTTANSSLWPFSSSAGHWDIKCPLEQLRFLNIAFVALEPG